MKHLLLALCLFGTLSAFSQSRAILLDGSESGKPVLEVFQSLEEKYSVRFFYLPQWLEGLKFEQSYAGQTLDVALKDIFSGSDISFIVLYNYAYILSRDPSRALEREKILSEARVEQKKILTRTFGSKANSSRNKKVKLSGIIKNVKTGEPMGGATIELSGIDPVFSKPDGSYSVEIPAGEYGVSYRYLNFEEKTVDLSIYEGAVLDVDMEEVPRILEEVVVTDKQISNVEGRVGITALKMSEVKKMPAFLGEVDIIKQIQVLPGVTSVGEVSSGFNVRGGGADQNLIQYDGVPIFNNSHVFGFFSGVSSDAIKDATFLKGGIPAEYGGRISSILNIVSKEGSYEKWGAEGCETYGYDPAAGTYYGMKASAFKQLLADHLMITTSGHYDFTKFFDQPIDVLMRYTDQCIEGARALGQRYITWPWLAPEFRSIENFKILTGKLNAIGERVNKAGLGFAYHNHDFEFTDYNGENGYNIIMRETDPSLVKLQLDLYWVMHSSRLSPAQLFSQQPGRFVMWHIKDMDKVSRDYSELGNGSIDFTVILPEASRAGLQYYYIEQGGNFAKDPIQSVTDSAVYFKKNLEKYLG